jgi:glutaredoxin 3
MVKQFLSQKGIKYEERDVSRNRAYAEELVTNTGQMGVPVTVIDKQVIVGFDKPRLEQAVAGIKSDTRPAFGASIADAAIITGRQGTVVKSGAYIGTIKQGSVAAKTGLLPGDIIIRFNKKDISSAADLEHELSGMKEGIHFTIVFLRGDRTMSVEGVF